jgi:hypothetical protein
MVSPQKIRFNNNKYAELTIDVITDVSFDSDNGEMSSFLNRSAVAAESYDGRYKNTAKYRYDELFSPKFTIVKADFSDFTQNEVRQVLKYLTQTDMPALLEVYDDKKSDVVDWAAIGGWTEISTYKIANNRTVGIVATFEAITPYAMSDIEPPNKIISETNKKFIIDTDDNQPIYPRITIQQKGIVVTINKNLTAMDDMIENTIYSNGTTCYWKTLGEPVWRNSKTKPIYSGWEIIQIVRDYTEEDMDVMEHDTFYYNPTSQTYFWIDPYTFHSESVANMPDLKTTSVRIRNTHDSPINPRGALDAVVVKNNTATEKIIIDGANKIISSTNTRRIFGDDFNWKWLELFDGENEITVEGNCEIQIEYRTVRKVGEY